MKKFLISLLLAATLFAFAACGGTGDPSVQPSKDVQPTASESVQPSSSAQPTLAPSAEPTGTPTVPSQPSAPTTAPTTEPTSNPTAAPTEAPAETVDVTFVSDGNEQIVTVIVGREIGTLPAAEKEGMDFAGWYCGTEKLTETRVFAADEALTFTAVFVNRNEIRFAGNVVYSGAAETDGTTATVTAAGDYIVTGQSDNGALVVNAPAAIVQLTLENIRLTSLFTAPISALDADKVTVVLPAGTKSILTDVDRAGEKPRAALHAKCDLTVQGEGALDIFGNNVSAIRCGADLKIETLTLTATAKGDAVSADGELTLAADITVTSGGDGIKTEYYNAEKAKKGNVVLLSGTVNVTSAEDGVQAERDFNMQGGTLTVVAGGGSELVSAGTGDGIKAKGAFSVTGGKIEVNAREDGMKAGGIATDKVGMTYILAEPMTISGCEVTVASGADGIKSDAAFTAENVTLTVTAGNERNNAATSIVKQRGIKGKGAVAFTNVTLNVSAYYDGVNSDGDVTFTGGTAEVKSIRKDAVQGLTVKLIGATLTCRAKRADKATPMNLVKDETSVFTALGLN